VPMILHRVRRGNRPVCRYTLPATPMTWEVRRLSYAQSNDQQHSRLPTVTIVQARAHQGRPDDVSRGPTPSMYLGRSLA
jgi:hypothetical protein